jgi:HAD superfamily hydrolase (TIGR01509 family)
MNQEIKCVILDAQGVTFNAPIIFFLKKIALELNFSESYLVDKWHLKYRKLAWSGNIDDQQLANELTDGKMSPNEFFEQLEDHFELGPMAPYLEELSSIVPIYVLSNHRSNWLYQRLKRFNLDKYIKKVFVSEQTGHIKPDHESFKQILDDSCCLPHQILFLDDQMKNINAANQLNINSIHVTPDSLRDDLIMYFDLNE